MDMENRWEVASVSENEMDQTERIHEPGESLHENFLASCSTENKILRITVPFLNF